MSELINGFYPYKKKMMDKQSGFCCWDYPDGCCLFKGEKMIANPRSPLFATVEHILPISKGGSNAPNNIRLAHSQCNGQRSNSEEPPYKALVYGNHELAKFDEPNLDDQQEEQ